jgi:hypothetical protein
MLDLFWFADFVGLAGSAPAFRKSIAAASLLECFRAHKCTRGCIARNTHCRALRPECRKWGDRGQSMEQHRLLVSAIPAIWRIKVGLKYWVRNK